MKIYLSVTMFILIATSSMAMTLSTRDNAVNIYNSENPYIAQVILVVPQNYPLTLVSETENYYKVLDFQGRQGWIEKNAVTKAPSVIVKVSNCNVRNGPGTTNEIIFRANRGVTFKIIEQTNKWIKVQHESGRQGWIYKDLVWHAS